MKLSERLYRFYINKGRYLVTLALLVMAAISGYYAVRTVLRRQKLVYAKSLDMAAVTVDGETLTLRDLAFYVAYEEAQVELQAKIYDPQKPNKYWNLHIDGEFVRIAARNAAIQMAVHDEIFYRMAEELSLELSKEEEERLSNSQADFWYDLTDEGRQERLGVTKEELCDAMRKVYIAQKCQEVYALMQNTAPEQYDFSGEAYQKLLQEHSYEIDQNVWQRITFGNVTLRH